MDKESFVYYKSIIQCLCIFNSVIALQELSHTPFVGLLLSTSTQLWLLCHIAINCTSFNCLFSPVIWSILFWVFVYLTVKMSVIDPWSDDMLIFDSAVCLQLPQLMDWFHIMLCHVRVPLLLSWGKIDTFQI